MIEIVYLDPANGTVIAKDRPISFSIRTPDTGSFVRVIVCVQFGALGFTELAYAQNPGGVSAQVFEGEYTKGGSVVTTIVDAGYVHFGIVLFREPFWPASPELVVYAFNTAGGELT